MLQAAVFDGVSFSPLSLRQDGLAASNIDVGGGGGCSGSRGSAGDCSARRRPRCGPQAHPAESRFPAGSDSSRSDASARSRPGSEGDTARRGRVLSSGYSRACSTTCLRTTSGIRFQVRSGPGQYITVTNSLDRYSVAESIRRSLHPRKSTSRSGKRRIVCSSVETPAFIFIS